MSTGWTTNSAESNEGRERVSVRELIKTGVVQCGTNKVGGEAMMVGANRLGWRRRI